MNEFIIKNGFRSQGDSEITGSLNVSAGITGSLLGTASYATQALSASFATSASWAPGGGSTSPGGSDQAVQFNSGSAFSGSNRFTYDYTINALKQGFDVYIGPTGQDNGSYVFAHGAEVTGSGLASHAEGYRTKTFTHYSHAEGDTTYTGLLGYYSSDIGNTTPGDIILPSGYGDVTSTLPGTPFYILLDDSFLGAIYGFIYLEVTNASWDGTNTILTLADSTIATSEAVIGIINVPEPLNADRNIAALASHAEGRLTNTIGNYSHAEGDATKAIGLSSHAEGRTTKAIGNWSHAEGSGTTTYGSYSHAEGNFTTAYGAYSHAGGIGTIASGSGQTAVGTFNTDGNTTSLFVVGNGTDPGNKSDLALFDPTQITFNQPLSASAGITGSLFGTSSWAITASHALTASYALFAVSSSYSTTSSYATTASHATSIGVLNQDVTITGSLNVFGTASFIYTTASQLDIGTNIITVNTNAATRYGGLAVIDSGSSPQVSGSLLFDSQNNQWIFVHQSTASSAVTSSILIMGPQTFNNVGNETTITSNRLTKGTGGDL